MKTLKDVAGLYKTLAQTYMVNGPWRPVYKTGNLYRQVGDYNSATQMIKQDQNGIYTLGLDYSPPAASYGRFVHNGHNTRERKDGSRGYVTGRPFAQYAANSAELGKAIDEFVRGKMQAEIEDLGGKLAITLGKFGNNK